MSRVPGPSRRFNPQSDPTTRHIRCNPPTDIIVYNEEKEISHLLVIPRALQREVVMDESSVVVFVDGACRGNGAGSNARASVGVYFGRDSRYNSKKVLPPSIRTSIRAEIEAFDYALDILQPITWKDPNLRRIMIVTDCEYLVNAMSQWIYAWVKNGGIRTNGEKAAHFETLKELHDYLVNMENDGFLIQFWHVPRELNREADRLANDALDEAEAARLGGYIGYSGYADLTIDR